MPKLLAEREGFEPPVLAMSTPDFESGTLDHSATSPSTTYEKSPLRQGKEQIGRD